MSAELSGRITSIENQISMLMQDMLQKLDLVGASNLIQVWNQQFDSLDDKYFYLKDNLQELQVLYSNLVLNQNTGLIQIDTSGFLEETFETVSKNLKQYPYQIVYNNSGDVSLIRYYIDSDSIEKHLYYNPSGEVYEVHLSGNTNPGIDLHKELLYSGSIVTGVRYY